MRTHGEGWGRSARRARRRSLHAAAVALLALALGAAGARADQQPTFTWSSSVMSAAGFDPFGGLADLTCGPSLCAAMSYTGQVLVSTDPAIGPGTWTATLIGPNVVALLACPASGLCVGGDFDGHLWRSLDPTAAQPTWEIVATASSGINAVSCPSVSFCAAVADEGQVLTATDPAGDGTWHEIATDSTTPLAQLACPSASLCVALDWAGDLITSNDPTGGADAWSRAHLPDPDADLVALACPDTSLCLALDAAGNAYVSTTPEQGAASWRETGNIGMLYPYRLSCPSVDRCLAIGQEHVVASTDLPAEETDGWSITSFGEGAVLNGVGCRSVTRCALGDSFSTVIVGEAPPPVGDVHVRLIGDGDGTIVAPGLTCTSTTCSGTYVRGTRLTLTPQPAPGSSFAGWDGACHGTAPCELAVGAAAAATADFVPELPPPGFRLSVAIAGRGSVAGGGIACPETCSASRPPGAHDTLTATPAAGWRFAGWYGACAGREACRLDATADHAVRALFVRRTAAGVRVLGVRHARGGRGAVRIRLRVRPADAATECALARAAASAHGAHPARRMRAGHAAGIRWRACRSPVSYARLAPGRYVFRVRLAHAAAAPAQRSFTIR
jgi:hypothetical protein